MTVYKTSIGRRSFLKSSALAGGGFILCFSWFASCQSDKKDVLTMPEEWFELNGYIKIGSNGVVSIMSPNPEGGQGVKTAMPMIIAEELDVSWENVMVEQAPLNTDAFTRQFIGGSQAIRRGWQSLRMAGGAARFMLKEAAAKTWNVPAEEITTEAGILYHSSSGKKIGYGEVASAAVGVAIPAEVKLKQVKDFKIIGTSRKNVDGKKIVTGKPLYGLDYKQEGMLIAMVTHPPTFGLKLKSFDATEAKAMPGIMDVFDIKVFKDDYERQYFDTCTFNEVVVVVGKTTWQVLNAKKALRIEWEPFQDYLFNRSAFGRAQEVKVPAGRESSASHMTQMEEMAVKPGNVRRKDGDPEKAFRNAVKIIERTYTAPFLAHNCMEPMNFFANVTNDKAVLVGPLQKPEYTEQALSARLDIPLENIDIKMTRLGGGYGRRSYAHFLLEAALVSQKMKTPVKLIYTREEDMTYGIYRPTYHAKYRAALDENNNLTAFHVKAGGIPESPLYPSRFPAGAVENYLAEDWSINSNITVGSFRAPRSNFMAGVEQSFLDEVAEEAGKDPIDFRLELLRKARQIPVGEQNDYDPDRYAGVLELVREKSNWANQASNQHRGVSAYFCHNTYVAEVLDIVMENGKMKIPRVSCAIDCGIVVNPDAATNMAEGAIVDGIGNALYGSMTFNNGRSTKDNFDKYQLIKHSDAPKEIDVHFVQNNIDPTGMGEPPFPPIFGALANAMYKATGKRYYQQPFLGNNINLG